MWRLLVSILFMVNIHFSVNIPCGSFNFGPASYFIPEFKWAKQELWQCFSQSVNSSNCSAPSIEPVRVKPKGKYMACTNDPSVMYFCPESQDSTGCQCNGNCLSWSTTSKIGTALGSKSYPQECKVAILALEDTFSPIGLYFVSRTNPAVDYTCTSDLLRVRLRVTYGMFDLFSTESRCSYVTQNQIQVCYVDSSIILEGMGDGDLNNFVSVRFFRENSGQVGTREIEIVGNWQQVNRSMNQVVYRPYLNQNTLRLRNYFYSPDASAASNLPYEVMSAVVHFSTPRDPGYLDAWSTGGGPWYQVGSISQLVHIVALDDAPDIFNPTLTDTLSSDCVISEKSHIPIGWLSPTCNFGSFFTLEDSAVTISISGVDINDVDVYETCTFSGQIFVECRNLKVLFKVYKGTMLLNSRTDLNFIENVVSAREGFLFTATVSAIASAVKVIYYNVDLPQLIATPASTTLNYNTQNGGNVEYISITVDDQGFTGWSGVLASSFSRINLTIVAVNNAPQVNGPALQYTAYEDNLFIFSSGGKTVISDVDVDEMITSTLARRHWMNSSRYSPYLNQLELTLNLRYGNLKVGFLVAPWVQLVATDNVTFVTVRNLKYGHDNCRFLQLLDNPSGSNSKPYSKVCVIKNLGSTSCPYGIETGCSCQRDGDCAEGDDVVLSLQKQTLAKKQASDQFIEGLMSSIDLLDRTCGGMPYFPSPNTFSFGTACTNDADCSDAVDKNLKPCSLRSDQLDVDSSTCRCCVNLSHPCASDDDCSEFNTGSPCGCLRDTVSASPSPGHGICGPYQLEEGGEANFTELISFPSSPKVFGKPCSYRGSDMLNCKAAMFAKFGTQLSQYYQLVSMSSLGSHFVKFQAALSDANDVVDSLGYISALHWNRLFRIPFAERDPLTFDIEEDSLDTLTITVDDLGNSGGLQREPLSVTNTMNIRVLSVNNQPQAIAPALVTAYEDTPYNFFNQIQIADPDSEDYGFSDFTLTVNLTAIHGRLYLNEIKLQEKLDSAEVKLNVYSVDHQEYRGLYSVERKYGDGCQFQIQCSDDSSDSKFGFYATAWYGIVYSPVTSEGEIQGCGICPEDTGNKFISINGNMEALNEVLSAVTYLPDPNFNTRFGVDESITFSVNDNGALGEKGSPSLSDTTVINVIVESVNDQPIIGRRVQTTRVVKNFKKTSTIGTTVKDYTIQPINKTLDSVCMTLLASSSEYADTCNTTVREYIDVDEDTQFFITPQVLWINDVDANESLEMPVGSRRYCCQDRGPDGCICGGTCLCSTKACTCKTPNVCDEDLQPWGAGQILVDISVSSGLLSFVPPPGRSTFPTTSLAFLTNISLVDFRTGGRMVVCSDQSKCSQNVSRLMIRAPILVLQSALEKGYLSYRGKPEFYGFDTISVWVNDQGYTDECYNNSQSATQTINVRVIGVNDPPQLSIPSSVLVYPSDLRCYVNYNDVKTNSEGLLESCRANMGPSKLPSTSSGFQPLSVSDVDIDDKPYGNLTLYVTIGMDPVKQSSAGSFFLPSILENSTAWYEQYAMGGLSTTVFFGTVLEINSLLKVLVYDGDPVYRGYLPFVVFADDNFNYGECSGDHACGYLKPVCYDPSLAGAHTTPTKGTTRRILDVMIGAPAVCSSSTCEKCNSESGCGWCPGTCPEQGGSCLVGSSSKPQYEICPADRIGRGWRQCQAVGFDILGLIQLVAGIVAGVFFFFLCVGRWIRRRHGTLLAYIFKKATDFTITARKLHLLPPLKANYTQFFFSVALAVMVIVVIQLPVFQNTEPTCKFGSKFYLDGRTTNVFLILDNCQVNFVPASSRPPPEHDLQSILIKFAFPSDSQIELGVSTCTSNKTFILKNNRADSVKYLGYYCNVEIVVPDTQYVIPDLTISASGSNMTSVRTGPPSFTLDFGPNTLKLTGNTLIAHIENILTKNFIFDVVHGRLIAKNLQASQKATFTSEDADMSVTTPIRTSLQYWQKSQNLVCLTAAPGSLYVENSCEQVCDFRAANITSSQTSRRRRSVNAERLEQPEGLNLTVDKSPFYERSLRILGATTITVSGLVIENPVAGDSRNPYLCSGNPSADSNWLCKPYNSIALALEEKCPDGTKYAYKKDVPQIDGCTDLAFCAVTESSQCLCKPACDMDKTLNPPGICNLIGECCQTICGGYSKADLFPEPNQERCPLSRQYCNGSLDQQFVFTSTSGQIALQVLPLCFSNVSSGTIPISCSDHVSSYKGQGPTLSEVTTSADILAEDQKVLDQVFHAGGNPSPRQGWFAIRTSGPGVPDQDSGEFVWVDSIREFVLVPWVLELFSFGLFKLERGASSARFAPGFCPAFVNSDSSVFHSRLIQVRQAVITTLQKYGSTIPSNSLLAFVPLDSSPLIFLNDIKNNAVTAAELRTSNYPALLSIFGFVVAIPIFASIVTTIAIFAMFRRYLIEFRHKAAHNEWASRQFSAILGGLSENEPLADVPTQLMDQVRGRTGFYYVLEYNLSLSSDKTLALAEQFTAVAYEMIFSIFPTIFVFLFADKLFLLYQTSRCRYRFDLCICLSEMDVFLQFAVALRTIIYVYLGVAMLEMIFHFLTVEYNILRRLLRFAFYTLLFIMVWQTITIISFILISVVVGFVVNPQASSIYTFTVAETLIILFSITVKMRRYQSRVRSNVEVLVMKHKIEKAKRLPEKLVDIVIGTHIDKGMHDNGLDSLSICQKLLFAVISIAMTCFFLFMGFLTFTDMTNVYTSIINTSILSASLLAIYLSFVGGDEDEVERDSKILGERISHSLRNVIDMLVRQTEIASHLLQKSGMQSLMDDDCYSDDE